MSSGFVTEAELEEKKIKRQVRSIFELNWVLFHKVPVEH